MSELTLKRTFIRISIGTLAFLVGAWTALGQSAVEKILTALAMPCGILWLLLISSVVLAVNWRHRDFVIVTVSSLVLLTITGNGIFADWLVRTREGRFAEIQPLLLQPFDVVIVLGGGATVGMNNRSQGNASGDRLILAAELYHRGLTRKLICTGKRIAELTNVAVDPSQQSFEILTSLGVPENAIEQFGGRNTAEEMRELGKRFENSDQRVGLLTSAWHLPRALDLANRNGFAPEPLPADFATDPPDVPRTTGDIVLSLIPQSDAMAVTTKTVKEYLGTLIGR